MKYVVQFGIIAAVSFAGELLSLLVPLPVPGSVYGLVLMLLSLTLVKSATGRFRIDQAFRFYVKVPTVLALVSLVLVWAL